MAELAYFKYHPYTVPVHLKNFESSWYIIIGIDPSQNFLVKA